MFLKEQGDLNKMKKNRILPLFGLALMGIAGGLFAWYEWFGGREYINYENVIVLKEEINRGQKVDINNLMFQKIEKSQVIQDAIIDENIIIGLEAKHFIPANSQLHAKFFDDGRLILKEDQYIAQIPVEWTLSVPNSMRRGDEIIIYSVTYGDAILKRLMPNVVSTNDNQENQNDTEMIEVTEINMPSNDLNKIMESTVAYVKDSANREVISIGENERLDGSSAIHAVEIVTTTEGFEKIEEQIKRGSKLIIMYKEPKKEGEN
jgi:hypothetical protein